MQDVTRMYTVLLPDRVESDRLVFQERRNQYITYIGTRTPIGPDGYSQISGFVNDPAIRFQIMWQGNMLNEIKQHKIKLIKQIRELIARIDSALAK